MRRNLRLLEASATASCSPTSVPRASIDASSRVSPVRAGMLELDEEPGADPRDISSSPSAVSHTHGDARFSVGQGENLANEVADTLLGQWPVSEIVGEEIKDGELHYLVRWEDTLEPARKIVHPKGVLKKWNNNIQALREKVCISSGTKRPRDAGSDAARNKRGRPLRGNSSL